MNIVLASGSPRRKQLLEEAGVRFRVMPSDADEALDEELQADPERAASALADRKAGFVVQQILAVEGPLAEPALVIGADTMVVLDGAVFGKPHSASEGKGMLRKLSGRTHQVITGVAVWLVAPGDEGKVSMSHKVFSDTSNVTFKCLSDETIDTYLKKGESYDKAGAYAIQGEGRALVESYEGPYDNIVGLPVEHLLEMFPPLRSGM
jgi:septum formation protein